MQNKNFLNTPIRSANFLAILLLLSMAFPAKSQMPQQIYNKLSLPASAYQLKFEWQGDSVNNTFEKHSAILVPVKLKGCPKTFYLQFDLGAPYSLFYKKKLEAIKNKYPGTEVNVTSANTASLSFKQRGSEINAAEINIRDFGSNEIDWSGKKPQIIGTIGVDLFDGQTLVIDYPKQKLTISPEIPEKLKKGITYMPFTYNQRSILLPAVIQNKKTMLFFDTGSSRYSLLTDEKTAKAMAVANAVPVTSKVSSWGRTMIANTLSTDALIQIGGQTLPLQHITFMQGARTSEIDMMVKMGMGGMTGNKLFLGHKLILDTRNKRFGLGK
ncbi:hypothetical protein [Daejeonella lutea]|uniref:Aspartyl protease n=1 Tax=Daejeonella lutea TaxID=572036 RepID=A0A1T5BQ77_9SPHI|nr:hypothetical protein [Daejeonella lutea]SKB49100.1 hypothetical protein SAMN05661099_1641 [Daejeonella lutea]